MPHATESTDLQDVAASSCRLPTAETIIAVLFLAILTGSAHFALAHHFGLYEDDYACAGSTLNWSWSDAAAWLKSGVWLERAGRPVGFLVGFILPFLAFKIGGLYAIYIACYTIVVANVTLFYRLLCRANFPNPIPMLGAIAFCLFPADTTHAYICHVTFLQVSITFLLIACHLYLNGGQARYWSYVVMFGSLLSYETAFLPFVVAPLLESWNRKIFTRLLRHALILAIILLLMFLVRRSYGETRAAETIGPLSDVPRKILLGCLIGPRVSLTQFAVRAWTIIQRHDATPAVLPAAIAAIALLVAIFWASRRSNATHAQDWRSTLLRPMVCGAAFLVPAYMLCFTHFPPDATYGRMTSVHVSAAPGVALIISVLTAYVIQLFTMARLRFLGVAIISTYFALLFGFSWYIQLGFARSWQDQKKYWSTIINLCPDAGDETLILLDGFQLPNTDFILTSSWADYIVWQELFQWPPDIKSPPQFIELRPDWNWKQHVVLRSNQLRWDEPPFSSTIDGQTIPQKKTILLQIINWKIVRTEGIFDVNGKPLELQARSATKNEIARCAKLPVYQLLIGN